MMNIRFALAKGRISKRAIALLMELGYVFEDYSEESRKLIFTDSSGQISFFLVKSPDVATYVEKGAADIGIVGKDILLEHPAQVYEILNLNIGKCKICVAGYKDRPLAYGEKLIVGTKYPTIAKNYFQSKNQLVDIIKINGSVELAPIIGLSDCIVDIVESGSTLKENGLSILEVICEISSRLIVNQVSLKTKRELIDPIIKEFENQLKNES